VPEARVRDAAVPIRDVTQIFLDLDFCKQYHPHVLARGINRSVTPRPNVKQSYSSVGLIVSCAASSITKGNPPMHSTPPPATTKQVTAAYHSQEIDLPRPRTESPLLARF
jgi:hypothetical protein